MKRLTIILLIAVFILSGCTDSGGGTKENEMEEKGSTQTGIWFSYSEINSMLASSQGFKKELETAVENCRKLEIGNVYIHVRSHCDSLFESQYFPIKTNTKALQFDAFEKMITAFHSQNIKVHAWINPYRVSTASADINSLTEESPAYKWLKDDDSQNDINVCFYEGIYLNPAEYQVRQLVIDGIREIIRNYDIDGIHFDDYFYPTADYTFDSASYEKYKAQSKNPLSVEEWRRLNVNTLISSCYTAIKYENKEVLFSVSPTASVEKNYNTLFADVKNWVENGCVDYIIPQLYFGFKYPANEYKFEVLLEEWKKLTECNLQVGLHIGLAPYKIGTQTEPDREEWETDTEIIAKQARLCYEDGRVGGYVLFSYSSVFSDSRLNLKQRTALQEYLSLKD